MDRPPAMSITSERLNAMLKTEPGFGVAKRASFLVAVGGPRTGLLAQEVNRSPLAKLVLSGSISGIYAGMTAIPQLALETAVDQTMDGPATSPEQVSAHRKALLAGNAGLMAVGVLAQRAINHSGRSGPLPQVGRVVATQLTVGAVAASIVIVSDSILGPLARRRDESSPGTMLVRTATLRGQTKALRKVSGALTMPTQPRPYAYVD